jgi:hypothetical protein
MHLFPFANVKSLACEQHCISEQNIHHVSPQRASNIMKHLLCHSEPENMGTYFLITYQYNISQTIYTTQKYSHTYDERNLHHKWDWRQNSLPLSGNDHSTYLDQSLASQSQSLSLASSLPPLQVIELP